MEVAVAATSKTLCALTTAALALPAVNSPCRADTPPDKASLSYRVTQYSEKDLHQDDVITGSTSRYDIDSHQFQLIAPAGDRASITANYLYETMSGASPMSAVVDDNNESALVMSGASIKDTRQDFSLSATGYADEGQVSGSLGYSTEDDYKATNVSLSGDYHFNQKLTTLSAGAGWSDDELTPTQQAGFDRIKSADKQTRTLFIGMAQVLSKYDVIQGALQNTRHQGFLSDPYKLDSRPASRNQSALIIKYRRFLTGPEAALHLDYRYFNDDWGIQSHTLKLSWYQNLTDQIQLVPSVRYYSQSQADFYDLSPDGSDNRYYSSDYRLSPYGAVTLGLKLVYREQHWQVNLGMEQYESDADLALGDVEVENPGLVDFTQIGLGIDYHFD